MSVYGIRTQLHIRLCGAQCDFFVAAAPRVLDTAVSSYVISAAARQWQS